MNSLLRQDGPDDNPDDTPDDSSGGGQVHGPVRGPGDGSDEGPGIGTGDGRGPVVRGVRALYQALVAYGACWVSLPEDQLLRLMQGEAGDGAGARAAVRGLAGPAPGHPERLCEDREFSELERRLMRELGVR